MVFLNQKKLKIREDNFILGFTIIELLVSISIIAVISALIFGNNRKFGDSIELTSAAQDVSLSIRQAQNYGSTVRESTTSSGQFNFAYGVVADLSNPTYITIFIDRNGNKMYDANGVCDGSGECVEKLLLRNHVVISNVCKVDALNSVTCLGGSNSIQTLFLRPSLDAIINVVNGGAIVVGSPVSGGQIILRSSQGVTKIVGVNSTGQISIQ